jgi:hypothetical protein
MPVRGSMDGRCQGEQQGGGNKCFHGEYILSGGV